MNCGTYMRAAKKMADIIRTLMQAEKKARFSSTSCGTRACSPARRSIATKAAKATTPGTSTCLLALLLALDLGTDDGWTSPRILALFGLFVVAFAAFVAIERR